MLRPPLPGRHGRDAMLRARLRLAEPVVWPPQPGVCPLCGRDRPAPSLASRYRGTPAHAHCVATAFPPAPPLDALGLTRGRPVPAWGWVYVAHIDSITDGVAHAHTIGSYRPGGIRPGTVLVVARRFGEVEEAVVYTGGPVGEHSAFQVPLSGGLTLGQGEWGRIHVRRLRGTRRQCHAGPRSGV